MPQSKNRRPRRRHRRPQLELLERRHLLTSNVFAEFRGALLASEQQDVARIHFTPENFHTENGLAAVGFLLRPAAGSDLSPRPVHIDRLAPGNVTILVEKTLTDGSSF